MTTTGDLDRRIVIERVSRTAGDFNEPVETWATLATVWASRRDVSDGEKMAAGQVAGLLVARFVVRSSATTRTVSPMDRLQYLDRVWNIHGVKETGDGRRRYIEITAAMTPDGVGT